MAETLNIAAAGAVKKYQSAAVPAEEKVVAGYSGYRAQKEGKAYRSWYTRYDPEQQAH